eukprot:678358-Alexandrium_andersonii.AAC.1
MCIRDSSSSSSSSWNCASSWPRPPAGSCSWPGPSHSRRRPRPAHLSLRSNSAGVLSKRTLTPMGAPLA